MLNINNIRNYFPSLEIKNSRGEKIIYLDGPGGTQVPNSVINAISNYYKTSNSMTNSNTKIKLLGLAITKSSGIKKV